MSEQQARFNLDSVWLKIGFALLPVLGIGIGMWADVRSLKSDRATINEGRIVRLEESQKAQQRELDDLRSQIKALWQRRSTPSQ